MSVKAVGIDLILSKTLARLPSAETHYCMLGFGGRDYLLFLI